MSEDQLLARIDIEQALSRLEPANRALILLVYRVEKPVDWGNRRWPPTFEDIGHYIGMKFEGAPLSEATIRYRRDALKRMWRGERGELRKNSRKIDLSKGAVTQESAQKGVRQVG